MTDVPTTPRKPMSGKLRLVLFERAGGRCHICERRIRPGEDWEMEHVIPLALGGADNPSNMAPAHKACHAPKTKQDVASISKAKRMKAKHFGIRKRSSFPCSRDGKWKKKINGEVVAR